VTLVAGDTGGGFIGEGYPEEAIDGALKHLNEALKLAPQDLSIHQGRLHVLFIGSRFEAMPAALEESLHMYKGSAADTYRSGIVFLKVLERSFPNDHLVVGNLAAMYILLKEDENAIAYLLRAVELAPDDPIDTWNLARFYDVTEKIDLAERWYPMALSLDHDLDRKKENACLYARFVGSKLKDPKRACEIQKNNGCEQTSCPQAGNTAAK
jgi:tetratricopeptide (TPR) repeat protein